MSQQVALRQVNHHLSYYVNAVMVGEEVIITKRGVPVARLSSIPADQKLSPEKKKVWARFYAKVKKGYPLGIKKVSRDEIYAR